MLTPKLLDQLVNKKIIFDVTIPLLGKYNEDVINHNFIIVLNVTDIFYNNRGNSIYGDVIAVNCSKDATSPEDIRIGITKTFGSFSVIHINNFKPLTKKDFPLLIGFRYRTSLLTQLLANKL